MEVGLTDRERDTWAEGSGREETSEKNGETVDPNEYMGPSGSKALCDLQDGSDDDKSSIGNETEAHDVCVLIALGAKVTHTGNV
jgi:hypothetical protein